MGRKQAKPVSPRLLRMIEEAFREGASRTEVVNAFGVTIFQAQQIKLGRHEGQKKGKKDEFIRCRKCGRRVKPPCKPCKDELELEKTLEAKRIVLKNAELNKYKGVR